MGKATKQETLDRPMRLAMVWNGTLQGDQLIQEPQDIKLGAAKDCVFPLPIGLTDKSGKLPFLVYEDGGFSLQLDPKMAGSVWTKGARHDLNQINRPSQVPLGSHDYGVITMGQVAVFFQQVAPAERAPRTGPLRDPGLLGSFGLSLFLHIALLALFFLARSQMPSPDGLELPTDLITKYMVTPPPEDLIKELQKESGTETEDPGLKDKKDAGGKKHKDDEGRVGREDSPQEDTEIAGKQDGPIAAKVRNMGLLGALSGGGEGNAIADALDVPITSDILSGLNSARTFAGRGSGGAGLRGVGKGGGGDGDGSLFGAGKVGTGAGIGRGGGTGRGKGGIGVAGKRSERKLSMSRGKPRVNGYLSAEQINRVVRANSAAIRYCYDIELQRQPNLKGRTEINWRINLQGQVTSARVARSTLRNARVEGCIVRQVRRWRFPKPDGGEVVVTYPFIFGVQGG